MSSLIGQRLRFARERAGLTQTELAKRFGFKDRQTLTAIETGQRKLTAEELVCATQIFCEDLDFFIDPLRLVGEGQFSWQVTERADEVQLDKLEALVGGWVALYRTLGTLLSQAGSIACSVLEPRLALNARGSLEEIEHAAQALQVKWQLGEVPAARLQDVLENELHYLVLNFNGGFRGISGACRLPGCNALFLNRTRHPGQRAIELASHAFHLLSWETLTPARCVLAGEHLHGNGQEKHIARLTKRFAETLLLPEAPLRARWEARGGTALKAFLTETAGHFSVTQFALRTRLVNLGLISADELPTVIPGRLTDPYQAKELPLPFSRSFLTRLRAGVCQGHISARRAMKILGVNQESLAELFKAYDLPVPVEL